MTRPIYRHLADCKWRAYQRKIVVQRITQMHVVPDLLPHLDPVADVQLHFGRYHIPPGDVVNSLVTEAPPRLRVQLFDPHPRRVTVAVVDADVPDLDADAFASRCHFLAANVPLAATRPDVNLAALDAHEHVVLPWLPPHAQKGSPYHRLAILVLEQRDARPLDLAALRERETREGFNVRSLKLRQKLLPIGVQLFRTVFDHGTVEVMKRAGLEGANVEYKRRKPESLPARYKVKNGARYR